jgi:hypothetical protein
MESKIYIYQLNKLFKNTILPSKERLQEVLDNWYNGFAVYNNENKTITINNKTFNILTKKSKQYDVIIDLAE